jgi:hypothetical protein
MSLKTTRITRLLRCLKLRVNARGMYHPWIPATSHRRVRRVILKRLSARLNPRCIVF